MIRGADKDTAISESAKLIKKSKLAIIFTGAGISTPSGIPDFRGKNGYWIVENPMEVASFSVFQNQTERFFAWFRSFASVSFYAKPNAAHYTISNLEKLGKVHNIITQNIDNLHTKAGSENVIELHGSIRTGTCIACNHKSSGDDYLPHFISTGIIPLCNLCRNIIKPDIVLFEELLPQESCELADILIVKCDLIIVVGSFLEVMLAAAYPLRTVQNGAKLIIFNNCKTPLDNLALIIIRDDIIYTVPKLGEFLR
jgi:NAD-dependent deacetylase